MSIYTTTFNALANSDSLAGLLAKKDDGRPAIFESWAFNEPAMPYLIYSIVTENAEHFAKNSSTVFFSIFTDTDSIAAEAIKNRIIKIFDRQILKTDSGASIRFYYSRDERIDEPEPSIVHWSLEFNAIYWREDFAEQLEQ